MGMPLRYNVRNLFRRKLRSFLTVMGIGLVVAIAVVMLAYSRGLLWSLRNNGDPDNLIVLSRRATNHEFSSIKQTELDRLGALLADEIAYYPPDEELTEDDDQVELLAPFISHASLVQIGGLDEAGDTETRRGVIQGVDRDRALHVHRGLTVREGGRAFTDDDERVAMVGGLAYARLGVDPEDLQVGTVLRFMGADWPIIGVFDAPGTSADGEIWVPLEELQTVLMRTDFSYFILKANDEGAMTSAVDYINRTEQMELRAVSEREYRRGFEETFRTFAMIGGVMALVITLGGVMVGMNTMYTAVAGRIREIGMLQVLGFSKRAVLLSFLFESVLITLAGGALGCALGAIVNDMPMTTAMGVFLFRVDGFVVALGLALAVVIGLVGAFIPAFRAVRLRMVDAMRYI
jgi:ABC-type antimicrobial peptide transport system permease subunit